MENFVGKYFGLFNILDAWSFFNRGKIESLFGWKIYAKINIWIAVQQQMISANQKAIRDHPRNLEITIEKNFN